MSMVLFGGKMKLVGIISHLSIYEYTPYENSATSVSYFYDWIMEELNEELVTNKTRDNTNN